MIRSPIFLFLLFNVFDPFTCVERSDWTWDPQTGLVTRTIANGTTYSCPPWDIISPIMNKHREAFNKNCSDGTGSANVSPFIRMDFLHGLANMGSSRTCVVPSPTTEEIFEKIETVYRSSLNLYPTPDEWLVPFSANLTKIRSAVEKCAGDGKDERSKSARKEDIKSASKVSVVAYYENLEVLPKLRKEVSALESELEEAKSRELTIKDFQSGSRAIEDGLREQLLALELSALTDSHQFELGQWYEVAKLRTHFTRIFLNRTELERSATCLGPRVIERRLALLSKMAEANESLAKIEATLREADYHLQRALPDEDDEDVETES